MNYEFSFTAKDAKIYAKSAKNIPLPPSKGELQSPQNYLENLINLMKIVVRTFFSFFISLIINALRFSSEIIHNF